MNALPEKMHTGSKQAIFLTSLFLMFFAILYSLTNQAGKSKNPENFSEQTSPAIKNTEQLINHPLVKSTSTHKEEVSAKIQAIARISPAELTALDYHQWASRYGLDKSNNRSGADPDKDGLINQLEFSHLTNPTDPDTDKDGYTDQQELNNGYDPDAGGDTKPVMKIVIKKIGVEAPVIWSIKDDESAYQEDLKKGTIHLPKTAAPGQPGNAIITGHSSNYSWSEGVYNDIFKDLGSLASGDTITLITHQQNGRTIKYHYQVKKKKIVSADDPAIFEQTSQPTLTVATCWPIGTNLKRLIVKAELIR